jgi:hypothetical protein
MAEFPLLKGTTLRATKINSCGRPIAGPGNMIVTDGFVSVNLAQVMKDADEIEQTNAAGKVCVADRTPPERKWYTADVELCQVNTGLIAMFAGWPQVLNALDEPVGFRDTKEVDDEFGVAIEVWTGGRSEDDCPLPESDDVFDNPNQSGRQYGYVLFGGTEWRVSSDFNITSDVNTITLSGITIEMTHWGRGPYNVIDVDGAGTAGRLLTPFANDQHVHVERTPITPPEPTPGNDPVELAIQSVFVGPPYYYGGAGGAAASDVAPDQPVTSPGS